MTRAEFFTALRETPRRWRVIFYRGDWAIRLCEPADEDVCPLVAVARMRGIEVLNGENGVYAARLLQIEDALADAIESDADHAEPSRSNLHEVGPLRRDLLEACGIRR